MTRLFFDIETVPAPKEQHALLRDIYAGKKKKAARRGKPFEETFDEYAAKTGLSGEFGRIVALAYAIDAGPVEVLWGDEREIVQDFWKVAKPVTQFIGHNVMEFDLPFVIKRSRVLGIKPTQVINFARYRQVPIFDTMKEWDLWSYNRQSSLDVLAKALDLPTSKDLMDGSEVDAYYRAGRIQEICDYCKRDVELTRDVYKKMTFDPDLQAR